MDHKEKARELFIKGHNCSQSVFAAYCDLTGYTEQQALKISSSMGGGMGRLREVCGACSAAFMVLGCLYGYTDPEDREAKKLHYERIQKYARRFKGEYDTIICRELLKGLNVSSSPDPTPRTAEFYKVRPCVKFIVKACELLDEMIEEIENGK